MKALIDKQRAWFQEGHSLPLRFRKQQLRKLYKLLLDNENMLIEAIDKDFKKSKMLTIENELSLPYGEINRTIRRLKKWTRPGVKLTNLSNFPARTRVESLPLGVSLVVGPWNYPYMLSLVPVISALAAGNTVILKPSEITSHASSALAEIINNNFPPELIRVVEGGVKETTELLEQKFDIIFFTGSSRVGKIVMKAASAHLTPVILELGGKNPVIVLPDCKMKCTAKRIAWGKLHNNGQACVSPDHVYVHESIREEFVRELAAQMDKITSGDPENSPMLPRVVNEANFDRLLGLINPEKVVKGGTWKKESLYIEPTIMDGVEQDDKIMQEEIFGPLLPILSYRDEDELITRLKKGDEPLALYIFTRSIKKARRIMREVPSGGGMINEVVMHFINMNTPFGGVGESGMGSYHGKAGFEAFSQKKSLMIKPMWFEFFLKYPPHRKIYQNIYRSVLGLSLKNLFKK